MWEAIFWVVMTFSFVLRDSDQLVRPAWRCGSRLLAGNPPVFLSLVQKTDFRSSVFVLGRFSPHIWP